MDKAAFGTAEDNMDNRDTKVDTHKALQMGAEGGLKPD
jgi:hypothetical protein